jgi:transposase
MSPQFVKPYVKTNKNDRNDAEAICEAVALYKKLARPERWAFGLSSLRSSEQTPDRLVRSQ